MAYQDEFVELKAEVIVYLLLWIGVAVALSYGVYFFLFGYSPVYLFKWLSKHIISKYVITILISAIIILLSIIGYIGTISIISMRKGKK